MSDEPGSGRRWCGFNLCEMFVTPDDERWPDVTPSGRGTFVEDHFRWIRDWGFNFVRLPMTYLYWSDRADPWAIRDGELEPIDRAVDLAGRYGLHLSLALHHAPGYCINPPVRREPFVLWTQQEAQRCFAFHWEHLAKRYRSTRTDALSFNLVNEPAHVGVEAYASALSLAIHAIRTTSPGRTIVVDGVDVGSVPVTALFGPDVVQSCRGYAPAEITHHKAWWAGYHQHPPAWPLRTAQGRVLADRSTLAAGFDVWHQQVKNGHRVHCGELGTYCKTPHAVTLAWARDLLEILGDAGIGWALWNFCGSFGILDSSRTDVDYIDWHGHRLDRAYLGLLQNHVS